MRAAQWGACLTHQCRTFGMHSTQHAETIQSAMQSRFSDRNCIFLQLVNLERMTDGLEFRHLDKRYRNKLRCEVRTTVDQLCGIRYGSGMIMIGHARHLMLLKLWPPPSHLTTKSSRKTHRYNLKLFFLMAGVNGETVTTFPIQKSQVKKNINRSASSRVWSYQNDGEHASSLVTS